MGRPKMKVQAACRDCAMCTGNVFTGFGRSMGRGLSNAGTFGIAALARKMCKGCDHPMSEHVGQNAEAVIAAQPTGGSSASSSPVVATTNPARWMPQLEGGFRWWNGENWTDFYTQNHLAPNAIEDAKASMLDYPPRWRQQDDGRYRWWAGSTWSDVYTTNPTGKIESLAPKALPAAGTSTGTDDLQKLVLLHASGALTDEEFTAAKRKLLGI